MTSAISNSTQVKHIAPVTPPTNQVKSTRSDSDGDQDGSKVAATQPAPALSSGNVGTKINTIA